MGNRSSGAFDRPTSLYHARRSDYSGEDGQITLLRMNDSLPYDLDEPVLTKFASNLPKKPSDAGYESLDGAGELGCISPLAQLSSSKQSGLRNNVVESPSNVKEESHSSLYKAEVIGFRSVKKPKHVRISMNREIIEYPAQS